MSLENLKKDITAIGADELDAMCQLHFDEWINSAPEITIYGNVQVTFQDPARPGQFRKFQCYDGDTFSLAGVRSTGTNPIIFILKPGKNVQRNMKRHAKGPGLTQEWTTAEMTLKEVTEARTFHPDSFLKGIINAYLAFQNEEDEEQNLFQAKEAGSW